MYHKAKEFQMNPVINEINKIRSDVLSSNFNDHSVLLKISNKLEETKFLHKQPCTKSLIKDLYSFKEEKKLNQTKKYINSMKSNFVISVFNSPYFNSLKLDGFFMK